MTSSFAPGSPSTNGAEKAPRTRPARPRRPDERRLLLIGLAVSLALHLVFLAVSRFVILFGVPEAGVVLPPAPIPDVGGMEVVDIRPVAEPLDEPASPSFEPAPPALRPDAVDPRPVPPVEPGAAPARTPTPARDRFAEALEALRPRLLDPRLRPGGIDALRTDDERAMLRV